jgi:hypothetical protein
MQPFNYQQQVVNPFEQAMQSAMQGFKFGAGVREIQEQRQAAMQAQARQQELNQRLSNLQMKQNPTWEDYESIALFLPEKEANSLRENFKMRSTTQQESAKKFSGQVAAALLSPNEESRQRGVELLRQRAEAERNAGNAPEAEAYELHAKIAETGAEGAKSAANEIMILGTATFGKDWAEGILNITKEPEAGFRPITAQERKALAAAGNPLPEGVPFQVGPKGEIKEVTRGPLVTVDMGQRNQQTLFKEIIVNRIKEFSDAASSARKLANDTRVINNLLKGAGGGKLVKISTELARDLGFESDTVAPNDLANSLAIRGAVQIRAPGSGATSDLEFRSYLQAFPSLSNSERGRELMSKYANAFAKRSARLADYAMKLGDQYTEEKIAAFDESLGPLLDKDFYDFVGAGPRRGVPAYQGPAAPAAPTMPSGFRILGVER